MQLFPLHANLTSDEQRVVFLPTSKRKVVVATNVAEVRFFQTVLLLVVVRHSYRLHLMIRHRSLSLMLSTLSTVAKSKKLALTQVLGYQSLKRAGSRRRQLDSVVGVPGVQGQENATNYLLALKRLQWAISRSRKFCVCPWNL